MTKITDNAGYPRCYLMAVLRTPMTDAIQRQRARGASWYQVNRPGGVPLYHAGQCLAVSVVYATEQELIDHGFVLESQGS